MKTIIHVASQVICDKFFTDFFDGQVNSDINQYVYVPYDSKKYKIPEYLSNKVKYIFSPIKKKHDRVFYFSKIKKYYLDLTEKIEDISAGNILIHAHSLFTDGGVAYERHKKNSSKYIVSVRTTDVDYYLKYFVYLKKYMLKILEKAEKVIFITENIKNKLYTYLTEEQTNMVQKKSVTIQNGVNEFWTENRYIKELIKSDESINILQVGRLTKTKNITFTLKIIKDLKELDINANLLIVGEGPLKKKILNLSRKYNIDKYVKIIGYLNDKNKLLQMYRSSDIFILPSKSETFGIVYIEALTQGLPVLYANKQGIYGLYEEGKVGYGLDISKTEDAIEKIIKIKENYSQFIKEINSLNDLYSWNEISNKHLKIYERILSEDYQ